MSTSYNILDPSALISALPKVLPDTNKVLKSPQDAIALALHASLSALAFRLIGIDDAASTQTFQDNVLPEQWNLHGPSHYTFRYRHEQSSLQFLVKVAKLGGRTLINAIAVENDKTVSLDIPTSDYTSASFYPHDAASPTASPLVHGFISSNRVSDLVSEIKLKIIQKLIPGLNKEGYTEEKEQPSNTASSFNPRHEPTPARPAAPEAPYHLPSTVQPRNPLEIGRRDLEPFPHNPFAPPSVFPTGGDGMFVGPDHPIFGRNGRGEERTPWGGDGFLPPMGAPPGARFDPVGPFGAQGIGRFPPRARGPLGDPDNDEFMPPGSRDMFM